MLQDHSTSLDQFSDWVPSNQCTTAGHSTSLDQFSDWVPSNQCTTAGLSHVCRKEQIKDQCCILNKIELICQLQVTEINVFDIQQLDVTDLCLKHTGSLEQSFLVDLFLVTAIAPQQV